MCGGGGHRYGPVATVQIFIDYVSAAQVNKRQDSQRPEPTIHHRQRAAQPLSLYLWLRCDPVVPKMVLNSAGQKSHQLKKKKQIKEQNRLQASVKRTCFTLGSLAEQCKRAVNLFASQTLGVTLLPWWSWSSCRP